MLYLLLDLDLLALLHDQIVDLAAYVLESVAQSRVLEPHHVVLETKFQEPLADQLVFHAARVPLRPVKVALAYHAR